MSIYRGRSEKNGLLQGKALERYSYLTISDSLPGVLRDYHASVDAVFALEELVVEKYDNELEVVE